MASNCRETASILTSHSLHASTSHPRNPHIPWLLVFRTLFTPVLRSLGCRKLHWLAASSVQVNPNKPMSFPASPPVISLEYTGVCSDLSSLNNSLCNKHTGSGLLFGVVRSCFHCKLPLSTSTLGWSIVRTWLSWGTHVTRCF